MTEIPFDPESVRALAAILVDTGLTEIEIEGKAGRIRVVRAHAPIASQTVAAAPTTLTLAPSAGLVPPAAAPDDAQHPGAVLSPMVGVVYLSSEPGVAAFVSPGQTVTTGQTLLLIEAMKTYNQIRATRSGVVTRILVGPGQPVEYGQPLLILE
jgi:acetyl-CoA carboxylase biotin carboxyl carrier protein